MVVSPSEQVSAERHLYSALQRAAVDQSDWAFDNALAPALQALGIEKTNEKRVGDKRAVSA